MAHALCLPHDTTLASSAMTGTGLVFELDLSHPRSSGSTPCLASLSEAACRSPGFLLRGVTLAHPRLLRSLPQPRPHRFPAPRPARPMVALSTRLVATLAGLRAALVLALAHASQQSLSASSHLTRQLVAAWRQHAAVAPRLVLGLGARLWQQRACSRVRAGAVATAAEPRSRIPTSKLPEVERLVQAGLAAERDHNVQLAVECFEKALQREPDSLALHCLAAKQWTDLSLSLDPGQTAERHDANARAAALAAAALALDPACAHAHVLGSIAQGRLAALASHPRHKVGLAAAAQASAGAALALDPGNDHAHHLLGRWHYEMARVNPGLRTLGRMAYGADLVAGSREAALEAYRRAAALNPRRLIHRVECGRVLLDLGRAEEARGHLEAALACEVEDLNAAHSLQDARRMLQQIGAARPTAGGREGRPLDAAAPAVPVSA